MKRHLPIYDLSWQMKNYAFTKITDISFYSVLLISSVYSFRYGPAIVIHQVHYIHVSCRVQKSYLTKMAYGMCEYF